MLANEHRGEVTAEIDGRVVTFRLDMGALGALMTAFGTDRNTEVFARLMGPVVEIDTPDAGRIQTFQGPSLADFPLIAWALSGQAIELQRLRAMSPPEGSAILVAIARAVALAMEPIAGAPEKKSESAAPATTVSR